MSYRVQSLVAAVVVIGAAVFVQSVLPQHASSPSDVGLTLPPPAPFTVRYQIEAMTLREKIGQLFMVSFSGTVLDDQTVAWMREYAIGGVILLGGNVESEEQTKSLIADLKERISKELPSPLLIAVDQEGGTVSRFRWNGYEARAQKDVGNGDDAYALARLRAKELRALGIHMNFSPVLDSAKSKNDFIYERAFRGDVHTVAALGTRMIQGYLDGGIIPVAKHYPGHGDTSVDSHKKLPVTKRDGAGWREHLLPFKEAVKAGVPAIMTAHVLVPLIDPAYPASISKSIVADILRSGLGFRGVVVSDDLGMGALTSTYTFPDIALRALDAGTDILLVVRDKNTYKSMIDAIEQAITIGSMSETRLDESLERILLLKHRVIQS